MIATPPKWVSKRGLGAGLNCSISRPGDPNSAPGFVTARASRIALPVRAGLGLALDLHREGRRETGDLRDIGLGGECPLIVIRWLMRIGHNKPLFFECSPIPRWQTRTSGAGLSTHTMPRLPTRRKRISMNPPHHRQSGRHAPAQPHLATPDLSSRDLGRGSCGRRTSEKPRSCPLQRPPAQP